MSRCTNTTDVRGVILAAGRGSRLGHLTATKPKCLVSLAGRSLLDWQLDALDHAGLGPVAIVRGYRGELIQRPNLHCFENQEWAKSKMVVSLQKSASWLVSAPCLIAYADIVYHPEIIKPLLETTSDIAIAYDVCWRSLWEERFTDPREDAESFRVEKGQVTEIGRRGVPVDSIQGQYIGLTKLTPRGWGLIQKILSRLDRSIVRQLDMTALLRQMIAQKIDVAAVAVEGHWCEVDRPEDLALYQRRIESPGSWSHDWRHQRESEQIWSKGTLKAKGRE